MINGYEDKLMVNVFDATNIKPIKSDSRMVSKDQEAQKIEESKLSLNLDNVSLSFDSKHLEALKASLQDVPEINQARVQYFKNEIESGQYEINSRNIAKNMLNLVEEL